MKKEEFAFALKELNKQDLPRKKYFQACLNGDYEGIKYCIDKLGIDPTKATLYAGWKEGPLLEEDVSRDVLGLELMFENLFNIKKENLVRLDKTVKLFRKSGYFICSDDWSVDVTYNDTPLPYDTPTPLQQLFGKVESKKIKDEQVKRAILKTMKVFCDDGYHLDDLKFEIPREDFGRFLYVNGVTTLPTLKRFMQGKISEKQLLDIALKKTPRTTLKSTLTRGTKTSTKVRKQSGKEKE